MGLTSHLGTKATFSGGSYINLSGWTICIAKRVRMSSVEHIQGGGQNQGGRD